MAWVNIFKSGTHTDSSGRTRTWTSEDLDKIASSYKERTEDAPVVFGHPKDNDPAQGWIKGVRRSGDFLQAQFTQVSDKAKKGLDNGDYKYGSLSLTPKLRIRHFGLLGAVPPAVKGLGRVEFQDDGGLTVDINFSEPDNPESEEDDMTKELEAKVASLEKQIADERTAREKAEAGLETMQEDAKKRDAEQKKATNEASVNKLIDDGKLLPADKQKVLAFCEDLEDGEEISFSEGEGKKSLSSHFLDFMAQTKANGLMHEFNAPASGDDAGVSEDLTQYV